jgi:hypothetical protein
MKKCEIHAEFWYGSLNRRVHDGDVGVDWRMISKWILEKQSGDLDCVQQVHDRGPLRALVGTAMNFRVQNFTVSVTIDFSR